MRLTWRDAATTAVAAGLLAGYGAYTAGVDLPLVSGPRAAGGAALLAGVAMCALGSASARAGRPGWSAYVAGALGSITLVAAIVAMTAGSAAALAVEVWTIVVLWLFATVHHAMAGDPVEPPPAEAMLQHYKETLPPRVDIR